MNYYLIWDSGTCNQGDHLNECKVFATLEEAETYAEKLVKENASCGYTYIIVKGSEVGGGASFY